MNIISSTVGTAAVLALSGRFDFSAHRDFRGAYNNALQNAAIQEIVIDFAKADYMDSSALGMLLLLRQGAEEAKKTVVLRGAVGSVRKVLEIANFEKLFKVE